MIWGLLRLNPLASFLGAMLLAVGLYTAVIKFENSMLTTRVNNYEAVDAKRKELAKAAMDAAKFKESQDKQRAKQLEVDNAKAKKTIDTLHADNLRLLADIDRLRVNTCGGSVPEGSTIPPANNGASTPQFFGSSEQILVEFAREADRVRENLLTCQAYVNDLHRR